MLSALMLTTYEKATMGVKKKKEKVEFKTSKKSRLCYAVSKFLLWQRDGPGFDPSILLRHSGI